MYHFRTPRRTSYEVKPSACYMPLHRVRILSGLRYIGLTSACVNSLIWARPRVSSRGFTKSLEDKTAQTHASVLLER